MSNKLLLSTFFSLFLSLPVLAQPSILQKDFRNESIEAQREAKEWSDKAKLRENNREISQSNPTEGVDRPEVRANDRGRGTGLPSCSETRIMMNKRINVLNENLTKKGAFLVKTDSFLNNKILSLISEGIDTSKLEQSWSDYQSQTENLLLSRNELITRLGELASFDCEGNPSGFKESLKEFNQLFRNQNLEFNKLNKEFRVNILYEINNLSLKLNSEYSSGVEN